MAKYEIENNSLTLFVKRSALFARIFLLFFIALFFLAPSFGMFSALANGRAFHIGFLFGIGLFALMGFYLLRIFLWNTYGKELIQFNGKTITYEADYGWFRDGRKTVDIETVVFSMKQIGFENENIAVLVIGSGESMIECVTKMTSGELEELIGHLKQMDGSSGA
ncbi:MAG: hypothetical protein ACJ77K_00355 [Bacteroidia bacterium]|jgi:hypothetical protein